MLLGQNGTCADNSKLNNNDDEFRMIIGLAKSDNFQKLDAKYMP